MSEFLTCTNVVFRRQMRMNLRNPAWVIVGLAQPVLYLFLFAPLLKPLSGTLGVDNTYTFFVPGLLIQLAIFSALFAGFGLINEWREGVVEAERVTPAPRVSLLLGRVLRDLVQLLTQATLLIILGYLFGMDAPLGGVLVGLLIALLLGSAGAAASNAMALTTKSEDVMAPIINMALMPILLLSGILLPMSLGPDWLQFVANILPFRHIVDGLRGTFVGEVLSLETLWALLWTLVLSGLCIAWGVRTFQRENA
ncbi:ABC transporter permease [Corynebacterium sp. TAE3-ERU12]|uniref:ABC transporter permease n=1 Tax=Corynebacterium sp. TAE3-ERU12 TaxID=2849491 RepID=UPI001C4900C0|nr:ABC transporter permease [Corynebacterium sp. TAE3-ERU12]MBV7295031.1 ABC transporter permease [Corynebacterium sp. TAE3-ERU12]